MRIDTPFPAPFGFHLLLLDDLRDRTRRSRRTAVVTILRRGPGIVHPRLIVRVLLAQNTFGWSYPSKYCNRPIEISYGGKTAKAKIVDSVRALTSI